jgi:SNF2 family DNA or RNA helicase
LQTKILNDLENDAQIAVSTGESVKMPALLALITRLRQAAVWPGGISVWQDKIVDGFPVYELNTDTMEFVAEKEYVNIGAEYKESAKLDKACELIEEMVADGQRVVVFSQFREPLIEMGRRLGDIAVEFHGQTPDAIKDEVRINFDRTKNEPKKWDVILANYKTGGVGLNFTACTQVIVLDEAWAPGYADQAFGRVNRLGQTEETTVHILRLAERIDEWMATLNEMKKNIVTAFNAATDIEQQLMSILSLHEYKPEDWEAPE